MSIQDSGGVTYSDHEIQWIRNDMEFLDSADSGPDTAVTDVAEFPVTARGLDNDELAELVYLRASIDLGINSVGDQTTRNAFEVLSDWGANLSGSEFSGADPDLENFDVDDSGTDDFRRFFDSSDEVGQWISEAMRAGIGFRDTANSVGANETTDRVQVEIDFRDIFGSGPFLDSTDDITNRIAFIARNAIDSATLDQRLVLGYNVQTVEGTRAAFGRP